jgi:glutathione synthase/RimK-type ligase-like ATP-grasp enzyme
MSRVALATCSAVRDLTADDRLLIRALEPLGVRAEPAVWDDAGVDWEAFDLVLIRSTWDYHHRRPEFLAWCERVAGVTALWNRLEVIRWNTHKSYLRELEEREVPVVPTVWLQAGSEIDLDTLMNERAWDRVAIKPAVSADAFGTILATAAAPDEGRRHLREMLATRDMMVQPYMPSVQHYGERSLVVIDDQVTHAVRRVPVLGEDLWAESGQTGAHRVEFTPDEAGIALRAVRSVGCPILYARVDLVYDDEGQARLMELELTEPSLFLGEQPDAAERLARAIVSRLR